MSNSVEGVSSGSTYTPALHQTSSSQNVRSNEEANESTKERRTEAAVVNISTEAREAVNKSQGTG
ncbi:MAG: hypothetical protein HQL06_05330 [Nitrospirae bacterium]|nr:hypothetical protein [Nitrospirota bacterium]